MITNFCLSHLSVHSLKAWLVIIQIHKGNHVWFTLANCSIESTASTKPMCSFRAQQHVMGSPNCIYELLIPCYEKSQWNSRGSVLLQGPWVREDPTAFTPSTCQPLSSLCVLAKPLCPSTQQLKLLPQLAISKIPLLPDIPHPDLERRTDQEHHTPKHLRQERVSCYRAIPGPKEKAIPGCTAPRPLSSKLPRGISHRMTARNGNSELVPSMTSFPRVKLCTSLAALQQQE